MQTASSQTSVNTYGSDPRRRRLLDVVLVRVDPQRGVDRLGNR
jgi:hypothetical protein